MSTIFISYARTDRDIVDKVVEVLEAAHYNIWIDRMSIDHYEDFTSQVEKGIQGADLILVFLSRATNNPENFARREIVYASQLGKPILPIVIESDVRIPILLIQHNHINISNDIQNGMDTVLDELKHRFEQLTGSETSKQITASTDARKILRDRAPLDRVFIAYSHKQRELAQKLYDFFLNNGKEVFYDAKIRAGAVWRQTIQRALDDATHLVVIWTPDAAESDEVEREVSYALSKRKRIVPILSKEIPELPYHLHGLHYIVLDDQLSKIESDLLKALDQVDKDIWN